MLRCGSYEGLLTAILFLAIVLTCGLTPMQTDTWWQLRAGQDMWRSGEVLLRDVYSHTAYGAFWPNHEWLAEVIFYGVYRFGGFPLLTLFAAALIAGGWAHTWRLTRGPAADAFVLTLPALLPAAVWWEPRPHAFSLLFIMMTVDLLTRGRYVWIPLVFLVWANTHGGVLLGFVLLGAGGVAHVFVRPSLWRNYALLTLACAAAVTATPLGFHFWTAIPRSLVRINQFTLNEWMRPGLTEIAMFPFWGIALAYCGFLARNWRALRHASLADATLHACALALLPGAVAAVRNVGPFLMIAIPALTRLIGIPDKRKPAGEHPVKRIVNLAVISASAIAVILTLASAYRNQWPRLRWTPVPDAALAALAECPGNLYNRYDEGGYLLWFAQDRKVFLDGRQDPYPVEMVLEHIAMETGKRRDYKAVFDRHGIRCAFLPTVSPTASSLSTAGWKTLYRDDAWVVLRQ